MIAEQWRPVVGHEDRYEVSSLGRVRSLRARIHRRVMPKILVPGIDRYGYQFVNLCTAPYQYTSQRVHVLVLNAFVGLRPTAAHMGAHRDADRKNNALSNLRWATQAENEADKISLGLKVEGSRHYAAKLKEADIPTIRVRLRTESQQSVADAYGVCRQTISRIVRGISWKSVHTITFTEGDGL